MPPPGAPEAVLIPHCGFIFPSPRSLCGYSCRISPSLHVARCLRFACLRLLSTGYPHLLLDPQQQHLTLRRHPQIQPRRRSRQPTTAELPPLPVVCHRTWWPGDHGGAHLSVACEAVSGDQRTLPVCCCNPEVQSTGAAHVNHGWTQQRAKAESATIQPTARPPYPTEIIFSRKWWVTHAPKYVCLQFR